ncbi:MAG: preprotein translocase subunit SecA [Chloroflexi bacterium]|nr:preprotein translocase subunit SecA [Chloroflexota bacterium]
MFKWLGSLTDSNERELKKLSPLVQATNSLEPQFERLPNAELREKTEELKKRLADGEGLEEILPEAFAAVREAAKRALGQRHFDVQLMGGIVLHQGKNAEMKTGEGKTLVATLPLYLNALTGKGCHLVTLNDYLARRDPVWMGAIFHLLGVSVASIVHEAAYIYDPAYSASDPRWNGLRPISRREAYLADITYGTNHEFGFDYLRDNMARDLSQTVQRPLYYAIVDEVDNILIDEARTPLIISGPSPEPTQRYYAFSRIVSRLKPGEDFQVDEKLRAVTLTDLGISRVEKALKELGELKAAGLYDAANYYLSYYLESALKAMVLFRRDRDYVVKDGQVIIVDEFTGRLMYGRRYSEGLHQAIEAKEGVKVQQETVTYATITLQNYFRMYQKLAGMTGTAVTEAEEFHKIYKLEVLVIPTHKDMVRVDHPDRVYKTEEGKFRAAAREIEELYKKGQPVLVGTTSIEKNEKLSEMLGLRGIPHQVLNAKHHEKEAAIIAQAGRLGAVTVATNMAGRGVDILLGGNPDGLALEEMRRRSLDPLAQPEEYKEALASLQKQCAQEREKVVDLGGLFILGTERHEARRIDNQLRGRSGRQGDPGASRFYISLEDELVRNFGGDRVKSVMDWAGLDEETPIEHSMVSNAIKNAQIKVEAINFDIRKHLVEYDDVLNKHREVIYGKRRKTLSGTDLRPNILEALREEIAAAIDASADEHGALDAEKLQAELLTFLPLPPTLSLDGNKPRKELEEELVGLAEKLYQEKEEKTGPEDMRLLERLVTLGTMDKLWVEHLTLMENMRHGIGLRAYGQADPLVAYKREGHNLFQSLLSATKYDVVRTIYKAGIVRQAPQPREPVGVPSGHKTGRNDPCPCGSGKKYKKCHGK